MSPHNNRSPQDQQRPSEVNTRRKFILRLDYYSISSAVFSLRGLTCVHCGHAGFCVDFVLKIFMRYIKTFIFFIHTYTTSALHPQSDVISTPEYNVSSTPQSDVSSTPESNVGSTPQSDVISTPQSNVGSTPQSDVSSTPQSESALHPQSDVSSPPSV